MGTMRTQTPRGWHTTATSHNAARGGRYIVVVVTIGVTKVHVSGATTSSLPLASASGCEHDRGDVAAVVLAVVVVAVAAAVVEPASVAVALLLKHRVRHRSRSVHAYAVRGVPHVERAAVCVLVVVADAPHHGGRPDGGTQHDRDGGGRHDGAARVDSLSDTAWWSSGHAGVGGGGV
jgi:hypothetical protein